MKADVMSLDGKKLKSVDLPVQFEEGYEPDLVNRAVLAIFSHNRQPYGLFTKAGQGVSAKLSRRRRDYKGSYGKGISRVPRKTLWRRGMQFGWVGAFAPGTTGGRRAHGPKASKIWDLEINTKERKKAIRSALSGLTSKDSKLVVVEDKFENIKNVKDAKKVLTDLGFIVETVKRKNVGKGRVRGRAFRYKKNALVVVTKNCSAVQALSNLAGYDTVDVKSLNASALTLSYGKPRECIFTEGAINTISKEKLFK
jgi:large subunit ribosomal protein L4e